MNNLSGDSALLKHMFMTSYKLRHNGQARLSKDLFVKKGFASTLAISCRIGLTVLKGLRWRNTTSSWRTSDIPIQKYAPPQWHD